MILSSEWLKQYVSLPSNIDEVLKKLNQIGLEVESVQKRDLDTTYLRISEIVEYKSHPNADRLSVCTVKTQDKKYYSIVCGAKNFKVGDKTILALPGAALANGLKIKESKIRGEHSQGMLCSETELGLSQDSQGILILPAETSLSDKIEKILRSGQVVFELNVGPHRPDCLSFLGVARELSAVLQKLVQYPKVQLKESKTKISQKVKVQLKDSKKCLRYMARLVEGVKVQPSPEWLQHALESIGQRSINNVVDVTNFVMMEMGQPLHAFDFKTIQESTLIIRSANKGESMVTLDGQKRILASQDLLICDPEKPLALAGIMGGSVCEVSETTTDILLESAYFDPKTIRRTSKKLGINSESSKRFEKGVDVIGVEKALDRAAQLIVQFCGGAVAQGKIDHYPQKFSKKNVNLTLFRLEQYLGYVLSVSEIKHLLSLLGFKLKSFSKEKFVFEVPSHRMDVHHEVDLIEEIARLKGYDFIPTQEPKGILFLQQKIENVSFERKVKTSLLGLGLTEVINYSFFSSEDLKKIGWRKEVIKVQNPIAEEYSVMRPTLVPSLFKNLIFNLSHQSHRVQIFELRPVFDHEGNQRTLLAGLISGFKTATHWNIPEMDVDFYDLKGVVSSLLQSLQLFDVFKKEGNEPSYYHPAWSSSVFANGKKIGFLGKIHPDAALAFDLKKSAFVFELEYEVLKNMMSDSKTFYEPLPKFPTIKRDLSILLSQSMSYEKIYDTIQKSGGNLLKEIHLFDLYEKDPIPKGFKSFAFALTYQSVDRTLTDAEINTVHESICKTLVEQCQVQIR